MKRLIVALFAVATLAVGVGMATNYTMTQGAGTTFGSLVVSAVNYPQMFLCDPTTPTQCAAVSAGGAQTVAQATAANLNVTEASAASILSAIQASIPAGTNSIGQVTATNVAQSTGGWTNALITNLLTTVNSVKASAGQVAKVYCYNPNSSVAYIQIFNTASGSVTVGTTTPANSLGIPATSAAGFAMSPVGDQYGTAISVAATTAAKNGTPPSTGIDCNVSFN